MSEKHSFFWKHAQRICYIALSEELSRPILKGLWRGPAMQHLWAPWRMRYILDSVAVRKAEAQSRTVAIDACKKEPCFICDAIAGSPSEDEKNQLVWRGQNTAVMLNRFPYNNGHLLIVPKAHLPALTDFEGEALSEPISILKRCMTVLDRMMEPQGYNVGLNQGRVAGAGLPGHLHWHLVPRWLGDVNFMPTISDTRVIVDSLESFYARFRQEFEEETKSATASAARS